MLFIFQTNAKISTMRSNKIFILCLFLSTSLNAAAVHGQTSTVSPNSLPQFAIEDGQETTRNIVRDASRKTIGKIVRDSNGNVTGSITRDANGNILYEETTPVGLSKGLSTNSVLDWELWTALLLTVIFGAIGGFVFELINLQGNVEKKHQPTNDQLAAKFAYADAKDVVDLGVWARVIIGAAAAPAAIVLLEPLVVGSAFKLIAVSVVAGSAGTAVFRAIQDRLLVGLAQKEKDEAKAENRILEFRQNVSMIKPKLEQANAAYELLYQKLAQGGKLSGDPPHLTFPTSISLLPEDLKGISTPLNEAKAMSAPVQDIIDQFNDLQNRIFALASHNQGNPTSAIIIPAESGSLDIQLLNRIQELFSESYGKVEAVEHS